MNALPSYRKPPVNEVVCGLQFQPIDKLHIPYIGLLWNKFRRDYPRIETAQPIAMHKGEIIADRATGLPLPRIWFINSADDQLIQFQFDRFYFNWRRRGERDYPRYSYVIESFEQALNTFQNFLNEFALGELKIVEFNLAYINHIPQGQGWNIISETNNIFLDFIWKQGPRRFLPNPSNIAWEAEFPMPEDKGNLRAVLKKGVRTSNKTPVLILELRTNGPSKSNSRAELRKWFDSAHEMIVLGFTDMTNPDIQKSLWEREDA